MALFNPAIQPVSTTAGTPKSTTLDTTASKNLMPANAARFGVAINNNATANLYINLGSAASSTNYVAILAPGGYYETPFGYTGDVNGIIVAKTNVSGTVVATEFT